jgi:hypothetical protein
MKLARYCPIMQVRRWEWFNSKCGKPFDLWIVIWLRWYNGMDYTLGGYLSYPHYGIYVCYPFTLLRHLQSHQVTF